jgi:tripartite-type tricarboxylate transporter receptor subunit TctC
VSIQRVNTSAPGKLSRLFAAVIVTIVFGLTTAQCEEFPSRTIKMVVPYAPGGTADVVARVLAQHMQVFLKQPVIIENRPGAGSAIGARMVAAAEPDGYTILMGNLATFAVAPAVMKTPGYDPLTSFVPLVLTSVVDTVLVARPDFPANSIKELIDYAHANPGKLSFGSAGFGHSSHLIAELLKSEAAIDMVHVPFRNGPQMSQAIIGGQVQIAFTDLGASLNLIEGKQLKGLAVMSEKRLPQFPDIPTAVEAGFPNLVNRNWSAAVVPANTPSFVTGKLIDAINKALVEPDLLKTFASIGAEAKPGTSEELAALIAAEYKKWSEVANRFSIHTD